MEYAMDGMGDFNYQLCYSRSERVSNVIDFIAYEVMSPHESS